MHETRKNIIHTVYTAVIAIGLVLGVSFAQAAWSGPGSTPPGGNIPAPINVGSSMQVKEGSLGVGPLAVFGDAQVVGKSILTNVDIAGTLKIMSGNPQDNSVLVSDSLGNASWKRLSDVLGGSNSTSGSVWCNTLDTGTNSTAGLKYRGYMQISMLDQNGNNMCIDKICDITSYDSKLNSKAVSLDSGDESFTFMQLSTDNTWLSHKPGHNKTGTNGDSVREKVNPTDITGSAEWLDDWVYGSQGEESPDYLTIHDNDVDKGYYVRICGVTSN